MKGLLHLRQRCRNLIKMIHNQAGFTLVELIVCFALTGIFMASSAVVVGAYAKISSHITFLSHAQTVSDILMNKISDELASMGFNEDVTNPLPKIESGKITYRNKDKKDMSMYIEEDTSMLVLEFKTDIVHPLGEAAYMGCKIQSLDFRFLNEASDRILKIHITLGDDKGFTFNDIRTIKCYN